MEIIAQYAEWFAEIFVSLMILASVVVQIIPGKKDDKAVSEARSYMQKILEWFPKFGLNPRTKAMQKALKELEK